MKYIYEFIGTFFLVFTVGMAVVEPGNIGLWAPLAIGSILATMVYAGGYYSGGHYNPAVSLAVFMRKGLSQRDLFIYWIAQLAAAIIAAFIVIYFKGGQAPAPTDIHTIKAFLAEFLFTFALCYVVLNVATVRETAGNSYFGWAIGFTVLAGAYAVGTISSAAFNPAVALGATILHLIHWTDIWIYFVANLLGGAAAAWVVNTAYEEREHHRPRDDRYS